MFTSDGAKFDNCVWKLVLTILSHLNDDAGIDEDREPRNEARQPINDFRFGVDQPRRGVGGPVVKFGRRD